MKINLKQAPKIYLKLKHNGQKSINNQLIYQFLHKIEYRVTRKNHH